ncbi:type II toxin-antitoxin system RelE/ParE family toxin [Desulfovibrio psychrotolerans]|uniref:Plasmid stabilization protein n=1 Tax=Desulfovibrio psychrotolerans TaxID=415242 RepID=A0A7J0BY79_9BACT|nr:type II toxin-antitoxin system RelE/ParE family toxin [Desulfovibrio psychrotolerans]GFM38656.1 hypothetical protein DSM19430T_33400 [Desulfovibrio psychrotolerans]
MKVVWTEAADTDRERIVLFIAADNPHAAIELDALFTAAADSLAALPFRGRIGRVADTRELVVHKNYILVYGHDALRATLYIKAVVHAALQYPPEPVVPDRP